MQPKEILVMDITKSEEELLAEMKPKTRYNIKLSQKHGVSVKVISNFKLQISNQAQNPNDQNKLDSGSGAGMANKYIEEFIRLVKITTKRDKITPHPENYYRKMFEAIPGDILKLYAAEYQNKVIAANLMIFFGKTATYLHGASDNKQRNLMAPYLLQWQAIKDAKKTGCEKYDFGGIKSSGPTALDRNNLKRSDRYGSWSGITKFKLGFAPNIKPIEFPGCYDIIINPMKYKLYRITQKIKSFL
jgi:lipid II:glycine glycyltransferase (peptidoglycan interpeptide bridge formation enzyme)